MEAVTVIMSYGTWCVAAISISILDHCSGEYVIWKRQSEAGPIMLPSIKLLLRLSNESY